MLALTLLTACAGANSNPSCACPPIKHYTRDFQRQLAAEVESAPSSAAWPQALQDYALLRAQIRAAYR